MWDRIKLWTPKPSFASFTDEKPKLKDPARLHVAYARWREQLGDLVEARESYQLALNEDPSSAEATLGLARLDQLNGRPSEAEQRYMAALRLKPQDPNVLDAVGQFYASQGRWKQAVDLLSRAMQADPDNPLHRYNLGVALAKSGKIGEAMPHFAQTVGEAEAHYNVGYILHQKGDLVGAERHFLQAVVRRPDLVQAQQMLDEVRTALANQRSYARGQTSSGRSMQTASSRNRNDGTVRRTGGPPVSTVAPQAPSRSWSGPTVQPKQRHYASRPSGYRQAPPRRSYPATGRLPHGGRIRHSNRPHRARRIPAIGPRRNSRRRSRFSNGKTRRAGSRDGFIGGTTLPTSGAEPDANQRGLFRRAAAPDPADSINVERNQPRIFFDTPPAARPSSAVIAAGLATVQNIRTQTVNNGQPRRHRDTEKGLNNRVFRCIVGWADTSEKNHIAGIRVRVGGHRRPEMRPVLVPALSLSRTRIGSSDVGQARSTPCLGVSVVLLSFYSLRFVGSRLG